MIWIFEDYVMRIRFLAFCRLPLIACFLCGSVIANAATASSVWIGIRTDGKAGSGTASDPFNGSTQAKFDALMSGFGANVNIYLLAGTYQTYGADSFLMKAGWKIYGAGIGISTIQQTGFNPASHCHNILGNGWSANNIEVHNLTLDGNHAALNATGANADDSFSGAVIYGSNSVVQDVETINLYGDPTLGREEFSILLGGANSNGMATNCQILDCVTHHYAAGATYTNGSGLGYCTNSLISNCTDDGGNHGVGAAASQNITIENNTTTMNTVDGFYTDTGTISTLIISHNWLAASQLPIQFNNLGATNVEILDNTLTTSNNSNPGNAAAIYLNVGNLTQFQITGNNVIYTGTGNYQFIANGGHNSTLSIQNNSGTASLGGVVLLAYATTDILDYGNFVGTNYFNGQIATPAPPPSSKHKTTTVALSTATGGASPSSPPPSLLVKQAHHG
ncbi:MAG: hypothetical protein LV480_06410 [Methylacidiphilales bacterium]|nr:hypothetical protein [Candidatus Methylacidiphilales bacterium]